MVKPQEISINWKLMPQIIHELSYGATKRATKFLARMLEKFKKNLLLTLHRLPLNYDKIGT